MLLFLRLFYVTFLLRLMRSLLVPTVELASISFLESERRKHHRRCESAEKKAEQKEIQLKIQFLPNFLHRHLLYVCVENIIIFNFSIIKYASSLSRIRREKGSWHSNKDSFLLWLCCLLMTIIHRTRLEQLDSIHFLSQAFVSSLES